METLVYSDGAYVPAYDLCRYYGVRNEEDVPDAARLLKRVGVRGEAFQEAVYCHWEATVGKLIPAGRSDRFSLMYQSYEHEAYLIQRGHLPGLVKYGAPVSADWMQDLVDQYMINGDVCVLEQLLQYAKDKGVLEQLRFNRDRYVRRIHNAIKCVGVLRKYGLFN